MRAANKPAVMWCATALALLLAAGCSRQAPTDTGIALLNPTVVEASCGECQFKLPGKGCDLAVRIDGQCYFVDGVNIDQLGDAHAVDGFCNAIRQARVTGEVRAGRFTASSFELLPIK